jgi:O-antigen ligase
MDAKKMDVTYIIQNIAVFGIVLGIFPFVPENLTTISFIIGLCMLAYRWLNYKQKPDCWGKIQWAPILGMLFFVAMLILASRFSLDVHKSSNVAYNYFKYMKPALMVIMLMNSKTGFIQAIAYSILCGTTYICLGPDNLAKEYFGQHMSTNHPVAIFNHRNVLSAYLAFLVPFYVWYMLKRCSNFFSRLVWSAAMILILLTLMSAQSRGAFIALFITAIVFLVAMGCNKTFNRKELMVAALTLIVVVGGSFQLLPKDNHIWALEKTLEYGKKPLAQYDDKGRLYLYEGAVKMIKDYPIFGVGLDNFNKVYAAHYMVPGAVEKDLPHAHNIILAFLTTTGIIGLCGFLVGQFSYVYFFIKNKHVSAINYMVLAGMLTFFLHNMVDFFFHQYLIEMIYWVILAMGYAWICLGTPEILEKRHV